MKEYYKVLNPTTGSYVDANSKEECINLVLATACELLMHYSHNSPVAYVTVNDDGFEEWRNENGDIINSVRDAIANNKIGMNSVLVNGTMPISILGTVGGGL
jgi:hypothetical protein